MNTSELLSFEKMVTPAIVKVLFWIGVIVCLINGLVRVFQGELIAGVFFFLLGPLMVRVYCELLIVIFAIHDRLVEVRNLLAARE